MLPNISGNRIMGGSKRFARWTAIAVVIGLITSCSKTAEPPPTPSLQLLASYSLSVAEPSGLAINDSGTVLWTVTNDPHKVYELDLTGNVVRTLAYTGHDLEGITYDPADGTLWVAEENRREVVHLDRAGNVLSRHRLGLVGELNSGLEGICIDDQGRMFVLNEKLPGMFIPLNADHTIARQDTLGFARDYSDITFNRRTQSFWILSDLSQRLFLYNSTSGVHGEYFLPFPKGEGVAYDPVANRVYVVSDSERKLYIYAGPS